MQARVEAFQSLYRLSGRLEHVLNQAAQRAGETNLIDKTPQNVYNDSDASDNEMPEVSEEEKSPSD